MGNMARNGDAEGDSCRRFTTVFGLSAKVANVDGAPWIRNQFEFHGLVEAIGLDFYHLRENLQKCRRIVFGEESAQGKTWLEGVMHTFRHVGYVRPIVRWIPLTSRLEAGILEPSRMLGA